MIYTGYYAKLKEYEKVGLEPVSIAGKAPSFYKKTEYKKFAPTYEIFSRWKSGEIDNFQYTEEYIKNVLNKLDKQQVKEFLISFDKDIVLLCYEKSTDFCHRHIVADWIESELGIPVDEYPI